MDDRIRRAYEYLVPRDQQIVDAVILSLAAAEIKYTKLVRDMAETQGITSPPRQFPEIPQDFKDA